MGRYTAAVDEHLVVPARVFLVREQEQALRLLGRPIASAVSGCLLIDTGSRRSTLLPSVIAHLNPEIQGRARIETSTAALETTLFWVRLEFPGTTLAAIPQLAVARMPLPPSLSAFHGIIGRDVLRRWTSFHYQGRRGRFTIRDTPGGLFGWLWR